MTMVAEKVDFLLVKLHGELIVNSKRERVSTEMFVLHVEAFVNALLANPNVLEIDHITAVDITKFIGKVLDDLGTRLVEDAAAKTIVAILSNPRLLCMVKEEKDKGGLE